MGYYLLTVDPTEDAGRFVHALLDKRGFDTSITYINNYIRFGIPYDTDSMVLHPSLNQTGSAHLRFACSNPNGQNIPKKDPDEENIGKTVRWVFGPAAGREWWCLDYENLELRIPASRS